MPICDTVFREVKVVDGSGTDAYIGSVGVTDDRIVWVSDVDTHGPEADAAVFGNGRVLAPGFIDVHTHDDHLPFVEPTMPAVVRQGVTTVVVGNCGVSFWPVLKNSIFEPYVEEYIGENWRDFGDYLDAVSACRPVVNVAALVGHGSLRQSLGVPEGPVDGVILASLCRMAADAVQAGALGISTGLVYAPGFHAGLSELVAVAGAVAAHGGSYSSHIRGEGRLLFKALEEAVCVHGSADCQVHVSHLKLAAREVWGEADKALELLASNGVTADQYPYAAWSCNLSAFLPPWVTVERLRDVLVHPEQRRRLASAVERGTDEWQSLAEGSGWRSIVLCDPAESSYMGCDLASVAEARGEDPVETVFNMLVDKPDVQVIGHAMSEDDVQTILACPDVMIASDAFPVPGGFGAIADHPRSYGTFPRVLGRYVRDEALLTLETAVRKMTSLPAERYGFRDRGRICEGGFADLVLFGEEEVGESGDYEHPRLPPRGIDLVLVNGAIAWDGRDVSARAGRVLRACATQ